MTSQYEDSFLHMLDPVDDLIRSTDNPLHRKILLNYRRHGLLEVAGKWEELLGPDMTVEHPVYTMNHLGQSFTLDGMTAVAGFYKEQATSDALVIWPHEQRVAVADWGFAAEVTFYNFIPGAALVAVGLEADDPDAMYLLQAQYAMAWHYASDGRLIGEHVYESPSQRKVVKPDPADVITPERAAELAGQLLADPPA
jgi:hypothetical protein